MSRRRTAAPAALAAVAIVALTTACRRAPDLSYEISFSESHPDALAVVLRLSGVPRDGLTLKGFATKEVLRVAGLGAEGPDGRVVPVEAGIETVTVNGRALDIPRVVLRGPLPRDVTVRYLASPGAREGDSHMGFTGRCEGYLGKEFGFATGREIILMPQPPEAVRRIEVRFSLPPSWEVEAPWARQGDRFIPGVGGALAGEHLVAAAIGLGRFRERSVDLGRTKLRLAFEASIPPVEEEQIAKRLETAARYVLGLFGRDLGPDYLTVVMPRAPTGDDIAGEGWATGQGQTLAPLTGNRLHQFALELIEAYVRHAPYRSEIRRPEEFWLVDGVTNLYAWRAVAASGLISEDVVTREMAVGYLTSLNVQGLEPPSIASCAPSPTAPTASTRSSAGSTGGATRVRSGRSWPASGRVPGTTSASATSGGRPPSRWSSSTTWRRRRIGLPRPVERRSGPSPWRSPGRRTATWRTAAAR